MVLLLFKLLQYRLMVVGFNSGTNLTGLETLTVTVGKSGDLTSASTMDEIDTIVLNGAGSSAYMAPVILISRPWVP